MTNIILNEDIVRRIVRAVDKAIADDVPQYLRENYRETNNVTGQLRGDCINDNLRKLVVFEGVELIPFQRFGWHGRILIDRRSKITYTITSQANLKAIPRKKGRNRPHFLQSVLAIENCGYTGDCKQLTLFPMEKFDEDTLQKDFNDIIAGIFNPKEGFRHYVVAYHSIRDELFDIRLEFLDKGFNTIDSTSLNEYIKPDFSRLTDNMSVDDDLPNTPVISARGLISVKAGIRPQLRDVEEQA